MGGAWEVEGRGREVLLSTYALHTGYRFLLFVFGNLLLLLRECHISKYSLQEVGSTCVRS